MAIGLYSSPDAVGSSAYRAVYDLIETVQASASEDGEDAADLVEATLEEVAEWVRIALSRIIADRTTR